MYLSLMLVVIPSSNFYYSVFYSPWALVTWPLELLCKCKYITAFIDVSIPYTITCSYTELKLYPLSTSSPWALVTWSLELLCKCQLIKVFVMYLSLILLLVVIQSSNFTLCLHPVLGLWSLGHWNFYVSASLL